MKKVMSLLLLVTMTFSFAGCFNTDSEMPQQIEFSYNDFGEFDGAEYRIENGELYGRYTNSMGLFGEDKAEYFKEWTKTSVDAKNIIHIDIVGGIILYLTDDGKVYILGNVNEKDLIVSDGIQQDFVTNPILLFEDCKRASLGTNFALFLKKDNTLWFIGESYYGQSAIGTETVLEPTRIADNVLFAQAFSGTTAWIDSEYNLYLCGNNSYGQIGNGIMGKGIPILYRDAVEEPFCALTDCVAFSVEQVENGVTVVRAKNSIGEKFVWGGGYGATPIYDDGRVKVDSHNIYDEYLPKEQEK